MAEKGGPPDLAAGHIICYQTSPDGQAPELRPGDRRRDWMGQTADANAYKCLPLVMANQHCWEICTPVGFEAEWDGGAGLDAVKILPDRKEGCNAASHFGSGILSFVIPAVFRTQEGTNLWLCPPVNRPKDAIQGLSGLIEADWIPYTFSMNWKFTRPGVAVRFETGEPFAAIFPVPRGGIEGLTPILRDVSEEPGLKRQMASALLQRNANDLLAAQGQGTRKDLSHQGWYMKGEMPEGGAGGPGHQTSLDVKPFRRDEGDI